MNPRCMAGLIGLCLILGAGPILAASYKYTDGDGVVHYTDNPYELPEPQRSRVLKKLERERKEREQNQNQVEPPGPPPQVGNEQLPRGPIAPATGPATGDGQVDHQANAPADGDGASGGKGNKGVWQAKLQRAKAEVASLQDRCQKLKAERDQNHRKSLIFATPGSNQAAVEAGRKLQSCQKKLEEARQYLKVGLSEEARKAGVPPGWVRD